MPNNVLNGIVLRATDYRESDRILNVLTKERGLVAVTARGCRKPSSKLSSIASQFCYGEMEVAERAGKLQLSSATLLESFYSIRESYEQLLAATHAVTAAERISEKENPNDDLFLLLYHALSVISYGENDPRDTELLFLAKLLKLEGVAPVLTRCVRCGRALTKEREIHFSNSFGGALCDGCGSAYGTVSALSLEAFRRMMLVGLNDFRKVRLPEKVRNELDPLIYSYAERAFEFTIRK